MTDIISGYVSIAIGLLALIVPNIASTLNSLFGFRSLYDMIAILFFVVMVFFGVSSFYDLRKNRNSIESADLMLAFSA